MIIVVLMGRSGCGKSTNEKLFEDLGYSRIISYTTRPMRVGEQNHVNYHFVSKDEFRELIDRGTFVEWAEYNGNFYGAPKPVGSDKYVAVLETDGFKQFKKMYGTQVCGVYIDTDKDIVVERLNTRNNMEASVVASRNQEDDTKFAKAAEIADIVVDGNGDIPTVFNNILKGVLKWRERHDSEYACD